MPNYILTVKAYFVCPDKHGGKLRGPVRRLQRCVSADSEHDARHKVADMLHEHGKQVSKFVKVVPCK